MISEMLFRLQVVWYHIRMLAYFDECYDSNHSFLILGVLFNPAHRKVHNDFLQAKRTKKYLTPDGTAREIKYTRCVDHRKYSIAKSAVDCFINSRSFFRSVVVDQRPEAGFDLRHFGKSSESTAIKKARAYKRFTELLFKANISGITNGILLTDRLTRCKGDHFLSLMTDLFGTSGGGYSLGKSEPVFRYIQEVDTALEQYHVGQISDILLGVILNELLPTQNKFKRKIREYLKAQLGLPSLGQSYWKSMEKWEHDQKHPKYQIWYWKPN